MERFKVGDKVKLIKEFTIVDVNEDINGTSCRLDNGEWWSGYALELIEPAEPDNVSHPEHYTDGGIETIDFIEAKKLNYHRGNAVKYISRAGKKEPDKEVQDIKKAIWYLERDLKRMEASE